MRRPIIDPRLRNGLPNHWPSVCTIQSITFASATSGQSNVPSSGTSIPGLTNLQCRLSAISQTTPEEGEFRQDEVTQGKERRILWINGYYQPLIASDTMWVLVDGVKFTIRGVESDSQKFYTRLRVEIMTPNG